MIKSQKLSNVITMTFLLIQIFLFICIQHTADLLNYVLKFLVVVFASVYSLLFISKNKHNYLVTIGLFLTVISDFFLVILDPLLREVGMIFFVMTQVIYAIFVNINQEKKLIRIIDVPLRIIISFIFSGISLFILKEAADIISILAVVYYINLIINIIFSFFMNNKSLYFIIGLILFALCDICVGLDILEYSYKTLEKGTFLYLLANPKIELSYIFYVPSQTCLALSKSNRSNE